MMRSRMCSTARFARGSRSRYQPKRLGTARTHWPFAEPQMLAPATGNARFQRSRRPPAPPVPVDGASRARLRPRLGPTWTLRAGRISYPYPYAPDVEQSANGPRIALEEPALSLKGTLKIPRSAGAR